MNDIARQYEKQQFLLIQSLTRSGGSSGSGSGSGGTVRFQDDKSTPTTTTTPTNTHVSPQKPPPSLTPNNVSKIKNYICHDGHFR